MVYRVCHNRKHILMILGIYMQFERVTTLANATPTGVLCGVWAVSPEYVDARKNAEAPMTIREAAILADLHGLRLEDVLAG